MKNLPLLTLLFLFVLSACGAGTTSRQAASQGTEERSVVAVPEPKRIVPTVVAEYPHDPQAYTQGLLWADGTLYESTGEYGQSSLRRVELTSGKVVKQTKLPDRFFGEGLALVSDSLLYQLTWQEQRCLVYDKQTFRQVGVFAYSGEGWGITPNAAGDSLYMSDGTAWIRVLNPTTFTRLRRFEVRDHQGPVTLLNELEWVNGKLWANIYLTDLIAIIDPMTGWVTHYVDCSALETRITHRRNTDVFNGVAHDPATGRIFVTGKNWDKLFEITLEP